jgi:hypothetical protein
MSIQTLVRLSDALKLSIDYILLGKTVNESAEPLLLMIESCMPDKQKYARDILKTFLLAVE